MQRRTFWLQGALFTIVLAGCGTQATPPKPSDRLLGVWEGTVEVNEDAVRGALPAAVAESAINDLNAMRVQMEFRADGGLILGGEKHGKPYKSQASWELVSADGEKMTLRSIEGAQDGVAPQEKTIDIRFSGNNQFTMPLQTEVAELGSLHFSRR